MKTIPFWRNRKVRYSLAGSQCSSCGTRFVMPRLVCPVCRQEVPELALSTSTAIPVHRASPSQAPPVVTVIIPSYNAERTIQATLASIMTQDEEIPCEIIVVDSSTDDTPRLVREFFPTVRLFHSDARLQSGAARNLGIREARGELIAFTDANCVVGRHWLERLTKRHQQYPDCAAIGGPIENLGHKGTLGWTAYLAEFNTHLPIGDAPYEVEHISTGNIAYKPWVFQRYGGFPGNEMVEHVALLFNRMLRAQGEKLLLDPHILVGKQPAVSLKEFLVHQRTTGRGTVQAMRHLSDIQGAHLVRHRMFTFLITPAIAAFKFVRNTLRFARWSPGLILRHPLIAPVFALGLAAWGIGFAGEVLIGEVYDSAWQGNKRAFQA